MKQINYIDYDKENKLLRQEYIIIKKEYLKYFNKLIKLKTIKNA